MALIRQSHDYDPARGPIAAYLFGIARNLVRRSIKSESTYVTLGEDSQVEENPSSELLINRDGPLEEFRRNEAVATVWQAVQSLPVHYREVVVLCDLNELRYSDAASILGCSLGTVRSRLHRAHALLLNKLSRKRNDYPAEAGGAERCLA
jgi:RNA polymerase sigma-70 factor (ECF subfamily)